MRKSIIDFFTIDTPVKEPKSKLNSYAVEGHSQTRTGTFFIENTYSAQVNYKDEKREGKSIATYQLKDYTQSCTGLIFQFAERFNSFTSDLELRLNDGYEVESIANHTAILARWKEEKRVIRDQFKQVPDIDSLLDNYEQNLANEEKLRNTLFYAGLTQLFFPRIQHLMYGLEGNKKFQRKRLLPNDYLGLQVPIVEELTIAWSFDKQIGASLKGRIDYAEIKDKDKFLAVFKLLYGKQIVLEDITFTATQHYLFTDKNEFVSGEMEEYFEVKGVHFKRDKVSFAKREK